MCLVLFRVMSVFAIVVFVLGLVVVVLFRVGVYCLLLLLLHSVVLEEVDAEEVAAK